MSNKKSQEEKYEYKEEELIEFIRENIPEELNDKLSNEDITTLIELEDDYIEAEYQKNEKRKPYIAFELITIDQDDINAYVLSNAVKNNLILNIEEVEEIMEAELSFLEIVGLTNEAINFN